MTRRQLWTLILLAAVLLHPTELLKGAGKLASLFIPFYVGFAVAYLLNPLLKLIENRLLCRLSSARLRRNLALLTTYALFLAAAGGVLCRVLPRLIDHAADFFRALPRYYETASRMTQRYPILEKLGERIGVLLPDWTLQAGSTAVNLVIGGIISVYLLHDKEQLIAQCKKTLIFLFREDFCQKLFLVARITHEMTRHFIVARLLDSLIVAAITLAFMLLFRIPYGLISALVVGFFNTIPYFGSILGAIPPALLILATKPSMLVPYLIFTVLLEQLDGNVIGPKLQGKQVGLSALWVLFAVFLFGGLFGFAGMVVGVPLFAVLYYFFTAAVNNGLHRKGRSSETADYAAPKDRDILKK